MRNGLRSMLFLPFFVRLLMHASQTPPSLGDRKLVVEADEDTREPDAVLLEFFRSNLMKEETSADPRVSRVRMCRCPDAEASFSRKLADAFRMDAGDAVCRNRSSYLANNLYLFAWRFSSSRWLAAWLICAGNADIKRNTAFHLASSF